MTTLLTIQHDPEGKLLKPLHEVSPLLNDLFREWHLVTTMDTYGDYMLLPWKVYFMKQQGMAAARRDVIRMALERADDNYFYCDLDRLIYWATEYPDELERIVQRVIPRSASYVVMGREHDTFRSHPTFQYETERMMNLLVEERYKSKIDLFNSRIDFFAGARSFTYQVAKWISEQSVANDAAQDIEWPLIAKENGGTIGYIEVEGLAYESAILNIQRDKEAEVKLRMTNLKSVLEFMHV